MVAMRALLAMTTGVVSLALGKPCNAWTERIRPFFEWHANPELCTANL